MKFNPKKAAFGRHETFPLRYSWLTKAYQEVTLNPQVFESDDSTVKLGVGKNMVNAIRYWSMAAGIIKKSGEENGGYERTKLGELIFDENSGLDPYLEDEATLWLLHWQLASNTELATGIYWLFNRYHKPEFSIVEALEALEDFTTHHLSGKYSKNTLKNDVTVMLRMYTDAPLKSKASVDDILDAPFIALKLLSLLPDNKTYQLEVGFQDSLPMEVVGYAIASLFEATGSDSIALEDLMYGKTDFPAPGAIFNLSEAAFVSQLDLLEKYNGGFTLRESAGINLLYKNKDVDIKPTQFLHDYFEKANKLELVA